MSAAPSLRAPDPGQRLSRSLRPARVSGVAAGSRSGAAGHFIGMDRDAQSFAALFQAHYRAVCQYIAARAEPDVVEDVAADTFTVAWRRRDELPDEPRAWLLGTAARCLANHRRSA